VRRPRPAAAAALALVVAAGAGLVATMWWWAASTPWDDTVVPLFVFVPVPVAVYALLSGAALRPLAVAAIWSAVAAVMVLTVALGASGSLVASRLGDTLDRMQVDAAGRLEGVAVPSESCSPAPALDFGPLGAPRSVCTVAYDIIAAPVTGTGEQATVGQSLPRQVLAVRQVRYLWDEPGETLGRTLVFEAAVAQPPADRCVRVVRAPWWAWRLEDPGCPRGFAPSSG
jgi:hypothetical protein